MAESAVTFLLNKLAAFLQEEVNLLSGVREEVEYVKAEFEHMKAFLRTADAMEEGEPELRVWVRRVRVVAYDTEDVLDEFTLRLAHHHGHGFYGFLHKIFYSVKTSKARHQIAYEIQSIKPRFRNITEGHQRYHHKFKNDCVSTLANNALYNHQNDALLIEEAELVGIDKPKQDLIELLVKGASTLKVVSVAGMGGLGKTTLVKKVYDDAKVKQHFQTHAWITVSQSFKVDELLKDLIQQLYGEIRQPVPQELESMNTQRLQAMINVFLRQSKYLLVLDDVWSTDAWDAVKYALPKSNYGSRVMLTTRHGSIASTSCMDSRGHVYNLKHLSTKDSWILFCRKTFPDGSCPSHLVELSRSILARCGDLPLAIVAISGVLATKDKSRIDEWEMVHRGLRAELEDNDKLRNLKRILSLSYNDLPYYLKSCFLYLSIFPDYHRIECIRVIRLWMAAGFVEGKDGKTLEEVAESYLNELLNRSLIQVAGTASDGRVRKCHIHDLLREIIILKSKDQNLVAIRNEQNIMCLEKVRCLSVHNTLQYVQRNGSVRLRSLLMFGAEDSGSKLTSSKLFSSSFKLLRVLDLQGAPLEMFPQEVGKLFQLRYLSLRDTKVKMLPGFIGKLQNLQTLDLKRTFVTKLPTEILKLQQLRHLLVYRFEIESYTAFHSKQGFEAQRIGDLQSLQKLCFIKADHGSGRIMEELGRLHQLRRLGIVMLREKNGRALCTSLEKLSNLRALSLTAAEDNEIIDLNHLYRPPPFLQRLYLNGRLEELPHWIPSLHGLVKLFLKWSRLRNDPLEVLQALPNLVHLEFLEVFGGDTMRFKAGGFQKLKLLGVDKLERLKSLILEEGAMPCLEKLNIMRCKSLQKVPIGIEHLTNLKVLEFFDMPDELINTLRPDIQGEDYTKVSHIPEVYHTYWRNGCWEVYSIDRVQQTGGSQPLGSAIRNQEHDSWK